MDTTKIDYLYDIYCTMDDYVAETAFASAYHNKFENGGGEALIANLEEYIAENAGKVANYFASKKDEDIDQQKIDDMIYALIYISDCVNSQMDEYRLKYISNKQGFGSKTDSRYDVDVCPIDLFKINTILIQDSYREQGKSEDLSQESFDIALNFINHVRNNRLLSKIYGSNEYRYLEIKEVISGLYDKLKDNQGLFDIDRNDSYFKEMVEDNVKSYFRRVKDNCKKVSSINFEQYRNSFISKKSISPEIDKIIFCKNLLAYYKTGIMVYRNDLLDCRLGYVTEEELLKRFNRIYSSKFNLEKFKNQQGNFIFDPDVTSELSHSAIKPTKFVKIKHVKKENSLAIGVLLRANNDDIYQLLHVFIKDIDKENSTFEIQLNLLPEGDFNNRIQLIRFDNWETKQPHKNLGNKLETTTHIHFYNHFDLMRGRVNGNFDIAYNFNENSTNFETALSIFLDILEVDENLNEQIYSKIIKIKDKCLATEIEL